MRSINLELKQDIFNSYENHCEKNEYSMSKRIIGFIESEIPKGFNLIEVNEIKFCPTSEFETVSVLGREYLSVKLGPNVFVIKTDIKIGDKIKNIMFHKDGLIYKLEDCSIIEKDEYTILECKKWETSYEEKK